MTAPLCAGHAKQQRYFPRTGRPSGLAAVVLFLFFLVLAHGNPALLRALQLAADVRMELRVRREADIMPILQ